MKVFSLGVGVFITLRLVFSEISDKALKFFTCSSGKTLDTSKMNPAVKVIATITINGISSLTFEFLLWLLAGINFLSSIEHYRYKLDIIFSGNEFKEKFPTWKFYTR